MRSCVNESTFVLMCFWVFCGVVDGEGKPIGVIVHESPNVQKVLRMGREGDLEIG